jgi:hypothetical protein
LRLELILAGPTNGTGPIFRHFGERRARSDAIIRIPLGWIIYVTADDTNVLGHDKLQIV